MVYKYKFKKKKEKIVPKPNPESEINGCGSYSLNVDMENFNAGAFNKCCNEHDSCYENCSSSKIKCDIIFDKCMSDICDNWANNRNDWSYANNICKKS